MTHTAWPSVSVSVSVSHQSLWLSEILRIKKSYLLKEISVVLLLCGVADGVHDLVHLGVLKGGAAGQTILVGTVSGDGHTLSNFNSIHSQNWIKNIKNNNIVNYVITRTKKSIDTQKKKKEIGRGNEKKREKESKKKMSFSVRNPNYGILLRIQPSPLPKGWQKAWHKSLCFIKILHI